MRAEPLVFLALATALATGAAHAGTFTFTNEANTNRVTHPDNYNGTGGPRTVTVCLDPAALPVDVAGNVPTDEDPTQALNNVAAEFTRDTGTAGNVLPATGAGIPAGRPDFESVAMHEVGHCLGLDHNTLGPSEIAGLGECDAAGMPACTDQAARDKRYFTNSYKGLNALLNLGLGADTERGSRDDARVDDLNFHWFRIGANNPFEVPPATVDRVAYSNLTAALPVGHAFVEVATSFDPCGNPGADTSSLRGQPPTSAIMFPVLCTNNVVRQTSWDDVTTLRIAKAGNNGVDDNGTGDDYTVSVGYIGQAASCDIVVRFIADAGFAFCSTGASITGTNVRITSAVANFERTVNWWFNQTNTAGPAGLIFRDGFENP
jgi:hypothetical protein